MSIKFNHNPVDKISISSPFGWRKSTQTNHKGVDLAPKSKGVQGDNLYSVVDGTVVVSKVNAGGVSSGYGYYVAIQHNGFATLYGHQVKLEVSVGDTVKAGDVIGHMGNTGHSTGVHCHFGVVSGNYSGLNWVNPASYFLDEDSISEDTTATKKAEAATMVAYCESKLPAGNTIADTDAAAKELTTYYKGSCWWVISKLFAYESGKTPIADGKLDIYRRTMSSGITVKDKEAFNAELLKVGQGSIFWIIKKRLDQLGIV